LTRGFAVVEFEGGHGRRLLVGAPGVDVEVVGTRFFVEVAPGGKSSVVGVKKGRVKVNTASRVDLIEAGTSKVYDRSTGDPSSVRYDAAAPRHFDDRFFVDAPFDAQEHEQTAAAPVPPSAPEPTAPAPATPPAPTSSEAAGLSAPSPNGPDAPAPSPAEIAPRPTVPKPPRPSRLSPPRHVGGRASAEATRLLTKAEALSNKGQVDAALSIYKTLAEDHRSSMSAYRPFARYEIARLYGFSLGQPELAERIFRELSRTGGGEVATQAAFSLCELDLERDPCGARACLHGMIDRAPASEVAREARQLVEIWGVDKKRCR
jgi:hypothetical protein